MSTRAPAKWNGEIELPPSRAILTQTTDPLTGERHYQLEAQEKEWIFAHENDCVPEGEWQ